MNNIPPQQEKLIWASLLSALVVILAGIYASYQNEEVVFQPIAAVVILFAAWYGNGGFHFLGTKPNFAIALIVLSGISLLMLTTPLATISVLPLLLWFIACYWA